MRKLSLAALALLLTCLTLPARPSASQNAGERFKNQVLAIAAASSDSAARRTAITRRLDEMGLRYCVEPFAFNGRRGANVIAELPAAAAGGARRLMLGAHYDRVPEGQGAIDNASGSAAVLELLAALQAKPLPHTSVTAAFFDLEEVGLRGSQAFIAAASEKNLPHVFINFDVFGYGDMLWVMSPTPDTPAAAAVRQAATSAKFPLELGPNYPPSDHLSFLKTKIETLSFSLIGQTEIPHILKMFKGEKPDQVPRVMSLIHTPNDTPEQIDAAAVGRALPVVEQAIRLMDAK